MIAHSIRLSEIKTNPAQPYWFGKMWVKSLNKNMDLKHPKCCLADSLGNVRTMMVAPTTERNPGTSQCLAMEHLTIDVHGIGFILVPRSFALLNSNAAISRAVCDGSLHDKMGGTTIHANGQRVQRRSAWLC